MELPCRPKEGDSSLRTGVTEGCEPPCGCWELNTGPVEDQTVLLIFSVSSFTLLKSV